MGDDFYCRYYIGHKGKFGHEFMEFEITSDGKLRYANNSNYKNDVMIRKEVYVGQSVIDEIKRIVSDSEVTAEDDNNWPQPDRVGRQELEIKVGKEHISFTVSSALQRRDCCRQNFFRFSDGTISAIYFCSVRK